ncbi:hypothetical protein [Ralstonia pseudosolanacearum]|uniref:hypothetical protein n=1 Tax=Ralstonia pseudosolanacearum TaxID=1310165 RepID=UPI003868BB4D
MLNLDQSTTGEPHGDALLRLAEIEAAIHSTAEWLTRADARAIEHELDTDARALNRVGYPKLLRRIPKAAAPTNAQGDLLG